MFRNFYFLFIYFFTSSLFAQAPKSDHYFFHFQQTVVAQGHPTFKARYSNINSLQPQQELKTTMTSTLFLGKRLWKHSSLIFNPEMAGGEGIGEAKGIAGFTNGEAFRVGDPKPAIYVARLMFQQTFNLKGVKIFTQSGLNNFSDSVSTQRIKLTGGKFSIADIFDCNTYSHDPRSQFLNWSLMSNGAWDYPANTRGYTWGIALEYFYNNMAIRGGSVMVPNYANGPYVDANINKAHAEVIEIESKFKLLKEKGVVRFLAFHNTAHMGNYAQAIAAKDTAPDITTTRKYGRVKYGFGINIEQPIDVESGLFLRASWNDGKNETWAFTEIDRSISAGYSSSGKKWKRANDRFGIAFVANGLSNSHKHYLARGGYGFIIGDGQLLNYRPECITELYYLIHIMEHAFITPNYQFVVNQAYNKDRGPVHVFAIRFHFEF